MPRKNERIHRRTTERQEDRHVEDSYSIGNVYGITNQNNGPELRTTQALEENTIGNLQIHFHLSFETIALQWLAHVQSQVKESTISRYSHLIHRHILPAIGNYPTNQIGNHIIEGHIRYLLREGRLDHTGGLSPKTVSDILSVLKCISTYSSECGYHIPCNFNSIKVRQPPREMRVLSLVEQQFLHEHLTRSPDSVKFGVLLCLYTGIRIGEVCALRWKSFKVELGILEIRETLQRIKKPSKKGTTILISSPKSTCSLRNIPIPSFLIDMSRQFNQSPEMFILTGKSDAFMEPRGLQYRFKKYLKTCGICEVNFHCLRHTFATRCVEAGFDVKSLSEILGHSSVNITLNRYVHASLDLKRQNMKKLDEFLGL